MSGLDFRLWMLPFAYSMALPVFKAGIQNWKGICIKINCSQMKSLNFADCCNGEVTKLIFFVKSHQNLNFSSKNTNSGAHVLLLPFFDNINF